MRWDTRERKTRPNTWQALLSTHYCLLSVVERITSASPATHNFHTLFEMTKIFSCLLLLPSFCWTLHSLYLDANYSLVSPLNLTLLLLLLLGFWFFLLFKVLLNLWRRVPCYLCCNFNFKHDFPWILMHVCFNLLFLFSCLELWLE